LEPIRRLERVDGDIELVGACMAKSASGGVGSMVNLRYRSCWRAFEGP
jgi:hypothetical protein